MSIDRSIAVLSDDRALGRRSTSLRPPGVIVIERIAFRPGSILRWIQRFGLTCLAANLLVPQMGLGFGDQNPIRNATPDPYFREVTDPAPGTSTIPSGAANGNAFQAPSSKQTPEPHLIPSPPIEPLKMPGSDGSILRNPKSELPPSTMVDDQVEQTAYTESFESGKVLALVGGEPIFVGDLMFEINQMIEQFMPTAPESAKEIERKKLIPRILPKFVEAKILYQGALRKLPEGVDVDAVIEQAAKEFDEKAMPKMIESAKLNNASELDAHLRGQGSSLRQLRRSWSIEQLTKYFVGQQLSKQSEITHQQMLEQYRENMEQYEQPAKARWEQIMIRFDKCSSPEAAREKLAKLGNEVVFGAKLSAIAKNQSHGFRAYNGGQHDWTTQGALVLKELDKAIFELPLNELSDIIETKDGFHIIRVLERVDATRTPFLEAQVEIKKRLMEEKRVEAFKKYLSDLKQEIPVEYLIND